MEDTLKYLLTEMCKRVGVNYEDIDFKKQNWFLEHTWTVAEENNYKAWFSQELINNDSLRNNLMYFPLKNPKYIRNFVETFMLSYSWKNK